MIICTLILLPIYIILHILIPIIQQVITTVCNWVSTILTTITVVIRRICNWLPWPLNLVCRWVLQIVVVVQTIWNYVCNTIIQTIISFITIVITLVIYVFRIICIIIGGFIGIPSFILCILGLNPPKKLRVCVKVLTDRAGNSKVTQDAIKRSIERTIRTYSQCNMEVIILGVEYVYQPQYLTTTDCSVAGLFSAWHAWFTQNACWCCNQVTVYFVDEIQDASGCAYWGDNWCRVDQTANADDTIMAHEIGHVLNLWHVNDPNNLMYTSYSSTAHSLTRFQCCVARLSPFVTYF